MAHPTKNQLLCRLLAELTPGLLPRDVFHGIARLMVTTTFVVVPLMEKQGRVLAFLHERDPDDLYYPSMLNAPGTVIRASDETLQSVYDRLIATEAPDLAMKSGPVFVGNVYDEIARGREISLIHWVEVSEHQSRRPFDTAVLPPNLVPTDRHRVEMAADHFRFSRS